MTNTSSPPALLSRKRKTSESTPRITNFFPTIKRQRSSSESKNVSQKLEDCHSLVDAEKENDDVDTLPLEYTKEELCALLGIPVRQSHQSDTSQKIAQSSTFENLPKPIFSHLFTILDMKSLSVLALTSQTMCNNVKQYVTEHAFYRRFQLDYFDFLNSGKRLDDDDFKDCDPFHACGLLIKSITITLTTDKRALVFLNICRNLDRLLRTNLCGFGRVLDSVTQWWKFSERRIMVKAAILIDPTLHDSIVKVLINPPGTIVGLEMKVRSCLTELFLNRNQEIEGQSPEDVIEFGAWLSVLLKNFTEKHQGRLYYLLFGPSILCQTGEKISWDFFHDKFDDNCFFKHQPSTTNRSPNVVKSRINALLNGILALRIMSNARVSDMSWTSNKIYRLFLRVVESCSFRGSWSMSSITMALAIDTTGLLTEYLVTSCDVLCEDVEQTQKEAADMICRVSAILYRWYANPSKFLSEPLTMAFKCLADADGYHGGPNFKKFLDEIWAAQNERITEISSRHGSGDVLRNELNGQLSMLPLLTSFSSALQRSRERLIDIGNAPNDEDEQLEG